MKVFLTGLLCVLSISSFANLDLKTDEPSDCVRGVCINDFYGVENDGLLQVVSIDEEDYVTFRGNALKPTKVVHIDILKKGFYWRDQRINEIQSCNDRDSRIYTCTTKEGYEVNGMKTRFDIEDIKSYLE